MRVVVFVGMAPQSILVLSVEIMLVAKNYVLGQRKIYEVTVLFIFEPLSKMLFKILN